MEIIIFCKLIDIMPSKETTTVVLTPVAQGIKIELAPLFGLKNILSAGLVLLNKLRSEDLMTAIQEANAKEEDALDFYKSVDILRETRQFVGDLCKQYHITGNEDDENLLKDILAHLGEDEKMATIDLKYLNRLIRQNILRLLSLPEGIVLLADAVSKHQASLKQTGKTRKKAVG